MRKKIGGGWRCSSVVKFLLSMHKAVSLIPNSAKIGKEVGYSGTQLIPACRRLR
jgi:hypothetical protein